MRVIVYGGREYLDKKTVWTVLDEQHSLHPFTTLITGMATGADTLAYLWALHNSIHPDKYPITREDWNNRGLSAGHARNLKMYREGRPEYGIEFPGGPGTAGMRKILIAGRVPILVVP